MSGQYFGLLEASSSHFSNLVGNLNIVKMSPELIFLVLLWQAFSVVVVTARRGWEANAPAVTDRLAPARCAIPTAARQRPLPNAEISGGQSRGE